MNHLAATLHVLGVRLNDTMHDKIHLIKGERDQGSVTIENILWALAVVGLVAIVYGAIRAYVSSQSSKLGGAGA